MVAYQEYRKQFTGAASGDVITMAPTHLDIELASVCSFRCGMCPQAETFVDWHKGFMDTTLALRLLNEAKDIGVMSVKLNWRGESTLHPDFFYILEQAHDLCFVDVMLNTNGAYGPLIGSQIDGTVDTLIYSIDSLVPEMAARLRPPGMLDRVIQNLDCSVGIRSKYGGPRIIRVNFTRQKENWDELPAMEAFCKERGIELYVKPVFPRNPPKQGEYYPEEKFTVKGRKNCGFPFQRLVVAHDGRVAPCCVPWNDTLYVGDVNKQSLLEIWNGPELAAIREAAKKVEYKEPTCLNCTSWASYEVEVGT